MVPLSVLPEGSFRKRISQGYHGNSSYRKDLGPAADNRSVRPVQEFVYPKLRSCQGTVLTVPPPGPRQEFQPLGLRLNGWNRQSSRHTSGSKAQLTGEPFGATEVAPSRHIIHRQSSYPCFTILIAGVGDKSYSELLNFAEGEWRKQKSRSKTTAHCGLLASLRSTTTRERLSA